MLHCSLGLQQLHVLIHHSQQHDSHAWISSAAQDKQHLTCHIPASARTIIMWQHCNSAAPRSVCSTREDGLRSDALLCCQVAILLHINEPVTADSLLPQTVPSSTDCTQTLNHSQHHDVFHTLQQMEVRCRTTHLAVLASWLPTKVHHGLLWCSSCPGAVAELQAQLQRAYQSQPTSR